MTKTLLATHGQGKPKLPFLTNAVFSPQAHASLECLPTNHKAGHIAGILYFYLFFE